MNAGTASSLSSPSPAVGKDGTIYLGSAWSFEILGYGFRLLAVTPAGATAWEWKTNLYSRGPMRPSAPAIDAAGTIYLAAYNSLYSFSPSGNLRWEFNGVDVSITSPTIGPDGTIYATFGSRLYAFYGTNAPADSSWPMYRQNPRHTGKVEKPSLQKPQKRSDANFQFELYAQIDQPYTIEASTNFNTWTSLTSTVATTVPMDVLDLEATNYPARFYRARSDSSRVDQQFRK